MALEVVSVAAVVELVQEVIGVSSSAVHPHNRIGCCPNCGVRLTGLQMHPTGNITAAPCGCSIGYTRAHKLTVGGGA